MTEKGLMEIEMSINWEWYFRNMIRLIDTNMSGISSLWISSWITKRIGKIQAKIVSKPWGTIKF